MDDERQEVLHGGSGVAFVDLFSVYLGADEDELHDDDGDKVDDPSGVVVEEEELGLVVGLSFGHKSLVLRFDLLLLGCKMLCKDLTNIVVGFVVL